MKIRCGLLFAVAAACETPGESSDDGGLVPDAGIDAPIAVEPLPLALVVQTPTGERSITTTADRVTVSGLTWGGAEHVGWTVAGGASGDFDGVESWSGEVPVGLGETTLTITATGGGAEDTDTIALIRNQQIAVASELTVEPDVLLIDRPATAFARIALTGPVDPARVELVRLDAGGARTPVAALHDDGVAPDDTAGDGFFAARFSIAESAPIEFDLVVEATPVAATTADRSPRHRVAVYAPPRAEDVLAKEDLVARAYQVFDEQTTAGVASSAAIDAVVTDLRGRPGVRFADRTEYTVGFALDSGQYGLAMFSPPELLGGAGPAPDGCRHAKILSPYFFSVATWLAPFPYVVDDLHDKLLAASQCGHFTVDRRKATDGFAPAVGVADFDNIRDADFLFLDTHGNLLPPEDEEETAEEFLVIPVRYCGPGRKTAIDCPPPQDLVDQLQVLEQAGQIRHGLSSQKYLRADGRILMETHYVVLLLPKFFAARGKYRGAVVIANACGSFKSGTLAAAFLGAGASAYVGWSDYVPILYAHGVMSFFTDCLLEEDQTVLACVRRLGEIGPNVVQLRYAGKSPDASVCPRQPP